MRKHWGLGIGHTHAHTKPQYPTASQAGEGNETQGDVLEFDADSDPETALEAEGGARQSGKLL